jgi:hypothetical protein
MLDKILAPPLTKSLSPDDTRATELRRRNSQLAKLELDYPFIYLASGGVSLRGLSPGCSFRIWRSLEKPLSPAMRHLAMFALITIRRADSPVKNSEPI